MAKTPHNPAETTEQQAIDAEAAARRYARSQMPEVLKRLASMALTANAPDLQIRAAELVMRYADEDNPRPTMAINLTPEQAEETLRNFRDAKESRQALAKVKI